MKEIFDPNRPYNRVEINKLFLKVKAEMHEETKMRGRAKYNMDRALYKDGFTGEELLGGDAYEYDHIRSAEYLFNKYKATHSDKQIAQLVNHRSNIIVTNTEINRFKGKYNIEDRLINVERVKALGIKPDLVKKATQLADSSISNLALKLSKGI